jgi:hypothetical protein
MPIKHPPPPRGRRLLPEPPDNNETVSRVPHMLSRSCEPSFVPVVKAMALNLVYRTGCPWTSNRVVLEVATAEDDFAASTVRVLC